MVKTENLSVVFSVVKRKIAAVFTAAISIFGGPNRDRTDDLTDANRTLSQA